MLSSFLTGLPHPLFLVAVSSALVAAPAEDPPPQPTCYGCTEVSLEADDITAHATAYIPGIPNNIYLCEVRLLLVVGDYTQDCTTLVHNCPSAKCKKPWELFFRAQDLIPGGCDGVHFDLEGGRSALGPWANVAPGNHNAGEIGAAWESTGISGQLVADCGGATTEVYFRFEPNYNPGVPNAQWSVPNQAELSDDMDVDARIACHPCLTSWSSPGN